MENEEEEEKKKMAKFSVERDEEESEAGTSSEPKRKKQRIRDGQEDEASSRSDQESSVLHQERVGVDNSSGSGNGSISVILTDPEVLDCSICMEPLASPVFQCENGHIACSSCCTKLRNKCPCCSWPIGYNRCLAIEKVVESVKVSCQNATYGCRETLSYNQKSKHEEACIYAPCTCPISECTFCGSSEQLSLHFTKKHSSLARNFRYNCPFTVCFHKNDPFLILRGDEDGLLFLLNNKTEHIGNSIMLASIGTSSSNGEFLYDFVTRRGGSSSLRFQSFTKCVKGQEETSSSTDFLLVPCDYFGCSGQLKLAVCIRRPK